MTKIQKADRSVITIAKAASEIQRLTTGLPERVQTFLANIPSRRTDDDLWPNGQPGVSPEEEKQVRGMILATEIITAPATRAQIVGHVMKLKHHSYLLNVDERMADAILEDWVEDLKEFSNWCIGEACCQWRRTRPGKTAGPGHIRQLSRLVFDRECRTLQALQQLVDGLPPRPSHVKLSWRHNPGHPESDCCGPKWVDEFERPVTRTGELLDIAPYKG